MVVPTTLILNLERIWAVGTDILVFLKGRNSVFLIILSIHGTGLPARTLQSGYIVSISWPGKGDTVFVLPEQLKVTETVKRQVFIEEPF